MHRLSEIQSLNPTERLGRVADLLALALNRKATKAMTANGRLSSLKPELKLESKPNGAH